MTYLQRLSTDIAENIIALDKSIDEYEFIHTFQGKDSFYSQSEDKDSYKSYLKLKKILKNIIDNQKTQNHVISRFSYFRDLITSACTQLEVFHLKNKIEIKNFIQQTMSCPLIPSFNLEEEYEQLKNKMTFSEIKSISDYKKNVELLSFKNFYDLEKYIYGLYDNIADFMISKYSHLWDFDLKKLLNKSKIVIETSPVDGHPCYYHYDGHYSGTIGITLKNEFPSYYLINFILHEVIPGHHFYYLIKQLKYDQGNTDECYALDLFYSPENIINEGLAINGFRKVYDLFEEPSILLSNEIEQYLHKILYNTWYKSHIDNNYNFNDEIGIMKKLFNFSEDEIQKKIKYYIEDSKFYTPIYPISAQIVNELFNKNSSNIWSELYKQCSVKSLIDQFNLSIL